MPVVTNSILNSANPFALKNKFADMCIGHFRQILPIAHRFEVGDRSTASFTVVRRELEISNSLLACAIYIIVVGNSAFFCGINESIINFSTYSNIRHLKGAVRTMPLICAAFLAFGFLEVGQ